MSQVLAQVKINAPTERVWEALVDSGRLSRWLPNTVNLDSLGRRAGGSFPARYYHYDPFSTVEERATGWEAGRRYSYVVNNIGPIKSAASSFSLSDSQDGTLLTQTVNLEMKFGPLGAVMDRLVFRPQFRKQMKTSLVALKGFVEEDSQPEPGMEAGYALAA